MICIQSGMHFLAYQLMTNNYRVLNVVLRK